MIDWTHVISGLCGGGVVAVMVLGYLWVDDLVSRIRFDQSRAGGKGE